MDCETLWSLFLATGLPEAYSLLCALRDEDLSAADNIKTA